MRKEYKDKKLSSELEELPVLQVPPKQPYFGWWPIEYKPTSDPKILRRIELLKNVFETRCFCEKILNCPNISKDNFEKLTLLDKSLITIDEKLCEIIYPCAEDVPPIVAGSKGAKFNKATFKWYFEYNDENIEELSRKLNKFINKTNEYQKYDQKLQKINTKELHI